MRAAVSEWPRVVLAEVASSLGGLWGEADPACDQEEVLALRGTDFERVRRNDLRSVPTRYVAPTTLQRRMLDASCVVIEASGGSKDQPVGRTLLISQAMLDLADAPLSAASFCKILRVDTSIAIPRFVSSVLENAYTSREIERFQTQSTGLRNLRTKQLMAEFHFRLPPISTQRRIAAVLSAFDELIEFNERRISLLEDLARSLYREWFVHFRFPGHEEVEFVNSELGEIPEGWEVRASGAVLSSLGGGTPSKKRADYWNGGLIPWFIPSDLTRSRNRYVADSKTQITTLGLKESGARMFPAGSVLMTSRATLGVLAITTRESTCNQGFIVIPPLNDVPSEFIYEWLANQEPQLAAIATGATFKEITKAAFKRFPFLLPTRPILATFAQAVGPVGEQISTYERQNRALAATRDLLLPRLVTGRLDISDVALGELLPADAA